MTQYIIDASVAVECVLETRVGRSVREIVGDAEVAAPTLLDAEVLAALRKGVQQNRISTAQAERAITDLVAWPIDRIPNRDLLPIAWRYRHNVTAYDALYVALASSLGVPLLTIDGPLSRASGIDIVVENVRLA
ncbi:MAG: type II toxin-antitoxin system VapC family toxin [Dehalococcoidia bacterium]|nr:type II toxin-antitoxin system VapC family toxin [Chloroflexota bacterium]MXW25822.1 type II toxin-antitoxin system VapC family toxin [Dehalococcoidia bacterium]MYA53499.1 type II toxin-antitoxin system VapC family toxin [Dehalococcoidia bacterium]